ncbi:RsmB/NOP family class I SAM-dependent RNA methyltransferase [Hansschlegelia quercus]|uniref:Methyltransferase domain-containing protein n=1 Tax=Hansschlegelia quercus TaxID=2528245 RepID=A0A4Q9GLR5_9HYPH|nr:transcription antitermination factor NusB [Hansschlegelia quercus]TBN54015.1 methyltransferase domain-containing protein [Hansschlegelia quercus]
MSRPAPEPPGLAPRRAAAKLVDAVLTRTRALDGALEAEHDPSGFRALPERDRALARAIAGVTLRRFGTLRSLIAAKLEKGLPKKAGPLEAILATGAAQALFMEVPVHTAVDLAVACARADPEARHFAGLANAVLRGIVGAGAPDKIPGADVPPWLYARWTRAYGAEEAERIAESITLEAPLDLTVKSDPALWAERLGGVALPNGTVRLLTHGSITALPGFSEGAWWVQDAGASLPAKLLGDIRDQRVIDLCAAPGGKTAQLAAAGAEVVAVDKSAERLTRLSQNLARLGLSATCRVGDAATMPFEPADAVLLDAPCSATGTIRRHPDVAWMKREHEVTSLAKLQATLLDAAVRLVKPGGKLVYCVCSLEPEEGERQVASLLARNPRLRLDPVEKDELPGLPEAVTSEGYLRTLPSHLPNEDPRLAGLDGFFAARFSVA